MSVKELEYRRESERVDTSKLLSTLCALLPTWEWDLLQGDGETASHFAHKNFYKEGNIVPLDVPHDSMVYNCVTHYGALEVENIAQYEPRMNSLFYSTEGVERLLIVYRAWARRKLESEEYNSVNKLIADYFSGHERESCNE